MISITDNNCIIGKFEYRPTILSFTHRVIKENLSPVPINNMQTLPQKWPNFLLHTFQTILSITKKFVIKKFLSKLSFNYLAEKKNHPGRDFFSVFVSFRDMVDFVLNSELGTFFTNLIQER